MAGEIGVMFNIPRPVTIRSRKLTQVVRISHCHLHQTVRPNAADGDTVFSNFVQYLESLKVQVKEAAFVRDHLRNERKIGKAAIGVLTVEGADVEDIGALRDGDPLFFCWTPLRRTTLAAEPHRSNGHPSDRSRRRATPQGRRSAGPPSPAARTPLRRAMLAAEPHRRDGPPPGRACQEPRCKDSTP
ncbi:hypothetical protein ABZP36_026638 [Zizania latifolia]